MDRNIKFRVWDKKNNKMIVGIELTRLLEYLVFETNPNSDAYHIMKDHFNELVWLQYTEINDKNDIEIYDGDIVKYKKECFDWSIVDGALYLKDIIGKVIFQNGEFKHEHSCFGYEGEDLIPLDECEVIGNIYKNKELLNVEIK